MLQQHRWFGDTLGMPIEDANHGPLDPLGTTLEEVLRGWRAGHDPLYRRLAAAIRRGIEGGELLPGTPLPPERALAMRLGVGRGTVVAAYQDVRAHGLVERRQGSGTVVGSHFAAMGGSRAAELSTSLRLNVVVRSFGDGGSGEGVIDFLGAHAPADDVLNDVMGEALRSIDPSELAEHHGYSPLGRPPLRRAVAAHLTELGLPSGEDEILITSGAQQAISLAAASCAGPREVAVLEDPTFPGAIDAFRMAGPRILTVPVHEEGLDVDALKATLRRNDVRVVYVVPTFHNPTGATISERGRRRLAALARATGVAIAEDNTLAELGADGSEPPQPIAAFSGDGPVLSIGSLSKLFWGGLRIGWIRAPRAVVAHLGRLKAAADLGSSIPSQMLAERLLPMAGEVRRMRRGQIQTRLEALEGMLGRGLPTWTWRSPRGGLCLWVQLPHGGASEFAQVAASHGVAIVPGPVMSARGAFDDFVRLPLSPDEDVLTRGVARLALAWSDYERSLDAGARLEVVV
jgi:DNA-binding transcriptional MocR family regulator